MGHIQSADVRIREMAAAGATIAETCAEVGCSFCGLFLYARRHGIKFRRANAAKDYATDERTLRMAAMYRQGLTLAKIGEQYGMTRERVRQLITKVGAEKAGLRVRAAMAEQAAAAKRAVQEARCIAKWGCGLDRKRELRPLIRAFKNQKHNADCRGIEWRLTFPQWLAIWEASCKLHLRGRGAGRYCMSRISDAGGYVAGNVHVQLCTDNSREAVEQWRGKPKKEHRGVFLLYPGLSRPYMAKVGKVRLGQFETPEAATAARAAFIAEKAA